MQLTIANDVVSLQKALIALARQGKRIGLVPTMGALHSGHMALVNVARQRSDAVVMSIFVNPRQFGPAEDFSRYPRPVEADIAKAQEAGVDVLYMPSVEDMYPMEFMTTVSTGALGQILCGRSRPGHFDGVATVVTKLLLRVAPHVAVFGEKDYQQLCVIRRVVYDLDIPMEILGMPTIREEDGLALSSRNVYLTPEERKVAPVLYQTLEETASAIKGGAGVKNAVDAGIKTLKQAGFKMDYLELRQAYSLNALEKYEAPARLLAAAWLGKTRLIDNIGLEG